MAETEDIELGEVRVTEEAGDACYDQQQQQHGIVQPFTTEARAGTGMAQTVLYDSLSAEEQRQRAEENERLWFDYIVGTVIEAKHRRNHSSSSSNNNSNSRDPAAGEAGVPPNAEEYGQHPRLHIAVDYSNADDGYYHHGTEDGEGQEGEEAGEEDQWQEQARHCETCRRQLSRDDFYFDILFHTVRWHPHGLPTLTAILPSDHPYINVLEQNDEEYQQQEHLHQQSSPAWLLGILEMSEYPSPPDSRSRSGSDRSQYNPIHPPLLIVGCKRINNLVNILWERYIRSSGHDGGGEAAH